jgi:filamentous hemagglutinin family protein
MNHVYRLLWSDVTLSFIVVAENAKSRGKRSGGGKAAILMAGAMLAGGTMAQQVPLPGGAQVSSGQASVSVTGTTMTVNQASAKAAINWDSFSIGKGGTVNFVQPSASSVVLNRVVGNEKSVIDGALNANGQVFLLNSNGVLFNRGASVNTAGLVASTLALGDADFNASNYRFSNNGATAAVINFGNINVADRGYAALLGRQVSNQGTITARLGTVAMAAGGQVTLNFNGNSLFNVTVDKGVLEALVENHGAILADGGQVVLTAKAVDALMANVVNNTGEIRARTLANRDGKIYLLGGFDGGTVNVAGKLDASAPDGGNGGTIDTSGAHVQVADGAMVSTLAAAGTTGTWLIDPNNYTIAASGGNITGAQLATSLNTSNVTIATATQGSGGGSGDIFVNDSVAKTGGAATTLTLLAERDINVNQAISSNLGRLNVVATADADNNATGSVTFNAGGSVTTADGNFYAAAMNGNTPGNRGQNFTMKDGSFINVGMGSLGIYAVGTVTLAGASLNATATTGYPGNYFNDGSGNYTPYSGNAVTVSASGTGGANRGAIVNGAGDAASANIIGTAGTTLIAGSIGTAAAPVTLSAPAGTNPTQLNSNHTLAIQNYYGDTYASEIGPQAFSSVSIAISSQANSKHNIQLLNDAGGSGANGTGHILLNTDAGGVLNLAGGDIDTSGIQGSGSVPTVRATSLTLSAPAIVFADNAVNTGTAATSYGASFIASGTLSSAAPANGVAEINTLTASLNGNVGNVSNPFEVNVVNALTLANAGSAYVSALGAGPSNITLAINKIVGVQSVLFANGDHINVSADGTRQSVGTIGNGSGIDLRNGNRSLTWTQNSGYVELGTDAINLGSGTFSMVSYASDGLNGAALAAVNAKDGQAEITAGDVSLQMQGGAGGVGNIEIAKGGTSANNVLTIYTNGAAAGDIDLAELSPGHFKSLSLSLYSNQAQNLRMALYGADDVNLAVGAGAMTLDAATLNLSGYNRNFQLSTSKAVRIDGLALGSGNYSISGSGQPITLNGDVLTNGGSIALSSGAGIVLQRSVRIDSNADDTGHTASTGNAGTIQLSGPISASAPGYALDVEAASSTGYGGTIYAYGAVGKGSNGDFLSSLRLNASGVGSGVGSGLVYLNGGSYLLNGDFASVGSSVFLSATTIDTEQGNLGSAGNISFSGNSIAASGSPSLTFDASTGAAGFNGGNIDLAGTTNIGTLSASTVTAKTSAGAGGSAGSIKLPTVSTAAGLASGTQTYRGGLILLYGSLSSNGGNILLDGEVRLARAATTIIDTWSSPALQTGGAGSVVISGGVSAATANGGLSIDTSVATNAGFYNTSLDYNLSGGAVSLMAGNAGGNYLSALSINTLASGSHNTGASGAMTLGGVGTAGNQTYSGSAATLGGDLVTNGGNINFAGLASVALSGAAIALKTDMAGGNNAAGIVNFGGAVLNGPSALTIDTTADGGGAASALTLNALGTGSALASLQAKAGSISVNGAIAATGDITLRTTGSIGSTGTAGALTLNNTVLSTAGNIVADSAAGFVNRAGSSVFTTGAGKNWQVWSSTPDGDTLGGLTANYKQYNAQYGVTAVLGSGNGVLYTLAPTVTASLTGSVARTYDGTTAATLTGANLAQQGAVDGDNVTLALSGTSSFADANAGSGKVVTANGISIAAASNGGQKVYGYQLANGSASGAIGSIAAKKLTVTGIGADTRVYDGSLDVTLHGGTLNGLVGTETLALGALSGAYADKNVGSAKSVTLGTVSLIDGGGSGANAGLASNYSIDSVNAVNGTVTARALTVGASGVNRVYDGGVNAGVTLGDNRVTGDRLVLNNTSASFADKNAGTGKTVSVKGIGVTGIDAANYTANTTAVTGADISARALAVSASGVNRVYDGGVNAGVTLADNRVAGDSLMLSNTSASFSDKNVGKGKAVSVTGIAINGVDAANYTVNTTAATSADITARALTVSASGVNRVYDGGIDAGVTLGDNRVAGDSLVLSNTSASFADKNAGKGKTVSVNGIAIGGVDAANYTANTTATTTADIAARALTVSAAAVNRVYDGGTAVAVTLADNRIAGDSLVLSNASASFAEKNAGKGKTVSVNGIGVKGVDAANYTVNATAATSADITPRALTVSAGGINRVYDGGMNAGVTLGDNRVAGDSLVLSNTSASFADKNAGKGKSVSVTGIDVNGLDAANYTANTTAATTADITARALTVSARAVNRVYDGGIDAGVTLGDNRVAGDSLVLSNTSASFADKNAGKGKTVSVNGIAIGGVDAANYTASTTAATTADITARALTVSASGVNRVYDGGTAATVTLADDRIAGDSLQVSQAGASFADKNAGRAKRVSVNGIAVKGVDAANYTVNATAATSADITPRALTVSAGGVNRVYDGGTAATVTLADNRVAGDSLVLSNTSASFANKNAGNGKPVSVNGIFIGGVDAANYTANTTAATSADIAPRSLGVTALADNKLYSGSALATVTLADNRIGGDELTVSAAAASFADANPGAGKTVTVSGISLSGADAANYLSNTTATTSADVTSNAAMEAAIGAVTNYNTVPTSQASAAVMFDRAVPPAPPVAPSGFIVTAPMQTVVAAGFRQGSYVDAVMAPAAGELGEPVSQDKLGEMLRPGADGVLRVNLQRNGVTSIVNGGVRLPQGVTQEFYIVPAQVSAH